MSVSAASPPPVTNAIFSINSDSRSGFWSAAWARPLSAGGDYADLYFESGHGYRGWA